MMTIALAAGRQLIANNQFLARHDASSNNKPARSTDTDKTRVSLQARRSQCSSHYSKLMVKLCKEHMYQRCLRASEVT